MDQIIYLLFSMLLLVSLVSSIGSSLFMRHDMVDWWYLQLPDDSKVPDLDGSNPEKDDDQFFNPSKPVKSAILQFIWAIILYGYLIPISLYVSIEVVKVLQTMLINRDIEMYDEVTCKSVQARTSNLNEELGQVEMILSDKTGTLTCNQMEFRKCSIAGISYGGNITEVVLAASKRMNADFEASQFSTDDIEKISQSFEAFEFLASDVSAQKAALGCREVHDNTNKGMSRLSKTEEECVIKGLNFRDERLMNKNWINGSNLLEITMFFRVMALCHAGIPVEDEKINKLRYEAESPEEVAFLIASQEFGFQFCRRTQSVMVLKEIDPSSRKEVER